MIQSITVQLVRHISFTQRKVLKRRVEENKRESLKKLFNYLLKNCNHPEKLDRELVFESVFSQKYEKKKDYLLRNELRLLNEEVYKSILIEKIERKLKEQPQLFEVDLIEALSEIQISAPGNLEKTIDTLEKFGAHREVVRLMNVQFKQLLSSSELSAEMFETLKSIVEKEQQQLKKQFLIDWYQSEQKRLFVEKNLSIFNPDYQQKEKHPQQIFKGEQMPPLARYYYLKALFYEKTNTDKLQHKNEVLNEALEVLESVRYSYTEYGREKSICLSNLGFNYHTEGRYSEAVKVLEEAIESIKETGEDPHNGILLNYASCLLKSGKYKKGIAHLEKYQEKLTADQSYVYRYECLTSIALMFDQRVEEAMEFIPEHITQRPYTEYLYFRFIYIIGYYLRGDLEVSQRELHNFKRVMQYKKINNPEVKHALSLFNQFFQVLAKSTSEKIDKEKLQELHEQIEKKETKVKPFSKDYLPTVWVKNEIWKLLN